MRLRFAAFTLWSLPLVGCSGVTPLATSTVLVTPGSEAITTRTKVDLAVKDGKYADAWDLEAAAGRDRARLETIALASLAADEGPYEKMLEELTKTFHGLSPQARARVGIESKKASDAKKWERAADVEIAAADDAPAYRSAFAVYEQAPTSDSLAVLKRIEKARKKLASAATTNGAK